MLKGISGGQKKRLTTGLYSGFIYIFLCTSYKIYFLIEHTCFTGELLAGPARVLFMDEISNGLDSSTTYQIIKYLRHSTHALDGTTVISLLQPAPETFELFDDVILLCEGQIVYQGPRETALDFFSSMGFSCPERKNVADFLQEVSVEVEVLKVQISTSILGVFIQTFSMQVISKKDQQQYWSNLDLPYRYIPVKKFADAFHRLHIGKNLSQELDLPFDRRYNHPAALSKSRYGMKRLELLKTSFKWQRLLMKRNSFIYVFKFVQVMSFFFFS